MGQHFTLGAASAQIIGQHVLPRLYGCRRLCMFMCVHTLLFITQLVLILSYITDRHLSVCLSVNHDDASHNCYTSRLVILHECLEAHPGPLSQTLPSHTPHEKLTPFEKLTPENFPGTKRGHL